MKRFMITVFIIVVCEMVVLLSLGPHSSLVSVSAEEGKQNTNPTIVIDSGHGGIDGGAVGNDGTVEKDINLSISLKLNDIFCFYGYDTIMTRTDDRLISDENADTIKMQKTTDIHNRLEMLEQTPNALLLSIHQNKYSVSKYSGAQVFYSKNNTQSKILASCIQNSIVSYLQNNNTRQIKSIGSEIYLLNNATKPAVMVECGFMSNPEELELLKNDEYQNKMALSIFYGVVDYLNATTPNNNLVE